MATEIERKFLVAGDAWRDQTDEGVRYRQGYLTSLAPGGEGRASIRVRMQGDAAYLNIKSATLGIHRQVLDAARGLDGFHDRPAGRVDRFQQGPPGSQKG